MNPKFFLLLVCIALIPACSAFAQHTNSNQTPRSVVKKDIAFIVRKPDQVRNIAIRFHIDPKELVKLNISMRRRQTLYAGKKIIIPVWLKAKDHSQAATDYDIANYELDTDSLDAYVREDFVCVADIQADTIRRIAIGKELRKLDRNIIQVYHDLDSIQAEAMHGVSGRDLKKIEMARERHTGIFTLASQIDTLRQKEKQLADERSKIDLRMADYQYLLDNASYAAAHPGSGDGRTIHLEDQGDDPNKMNTTAPKTKKLGQL